MTISVTRRDSPDGHFSLTFEAAKDQKTIVKAFLDGSSVSQLQILSDYFYDEGIIGDMIRQDLQEKTDTLNKINAKLIQEGF